MKRPFASLGVNVALALIALLTLLPLAWMVVVVVANPAVRNEFSLSAFRAALLGRTLGYNAAAAVIAAMRPPAPRRSST